MFTKNILNSDGSIRWVGITDQNGNIINERYREGLSMDDKIFIFLNIIICYIWISIPDLFKKIC